MNTSFTPPTPTQRRTILEEYGFKFDRRIRESECQEITSLSRSTRWNMENEKNSRPVVTLAVIVAPGFLVMCSGGFAIPQPSRTLIHHIAENQLN